MSKYMWFGLLTDYEELWLRVGFNALMEKSLHDRQQRKIIMCARGFSKAASQVIITDRAIRDLGESMAVINTKLVNEPFRGFRQKQGKKQRRIL